VKQLLTGLAMAAIFALPSLAAAQPLPPPDPRATLHVVAENDAFGNNRTDRWYTNGLRLGYQSPESELPLPFGWLNQGLEGLLGPANARWGVALGQNIYTPSNVRSFVPSPSDRPYAGYAYLDFLLDRRTANRLDRFSLQAGVVGPSSLARKTQGIFHELIGEREARGWRYQLRNEPSFNLGWQRIWRQRVVTLPGGIAVDVLPAAEVAAGTVAVYGQGALRMRLGQGLERDFGPARIRPGNADAPAPVGEGFGWYVFAGAAGRLVGRDIFLDGNTWRQGSPSVKRRTGVADYEAGVAVFWNGVRLSLTESWRTEEFAGQRKWFNFGIISLTASF
jgi:hypothetical protein